MFSWTSPKCIGLVAHVQQDPDELRSSTGSFDNSYGGVKNCDFSFTDLLHLQCPTPLYGRTRNLWIDSGGTPCSSSQHTFEVFAKPHISVRNLTKTTPICVVVSHTHSLNRRTVSKHTSVGFMISYRIITIFWDLGLWDFCKNTSNSFSIGRFCWQYL
jgi:hypothetical protein